MKTICMLLALLGALLTVTGCNTVKGVGRDVEDLGEAMEDAVD